MKVSYGQGLVFTLINIFGKGNGPKAILCSLDWKLTTNDTSLTGNFWSFDYIVSCKMCGKLLGNNSETTVE